MNDKKIRIIDIILVLLEKKRFLIISLAIASIAAVVTTLVMKKYYTASAMLLPSKNTSFSSPLTSLMSDLPISNMMESFDFLSGGSDNDQILSILESRRLALMVVTRFNLAERYKFTKKKKYYIEDVLRSFHKKYEAFENDLKTITITFTDTSPSFAAEVVNYIIGELDTINYDISRQSARYTRLFFEERLKLVKNDMDSAHSNLASFQEKHNFLDPEEQVMSAVEALSYIEAHILNNDINTELLKTRYGSGSYEVKELLKNRRILEKRLSHYVDSGSGELLLPLKQAPRLAIEYSKYLRRVKVQEMLHAFLLQNYEQAKLTEANNTPTVNVLEAANIPQKKSRPKRSIICLIFFTIAFFIISSLIFIQKWFLLQKQQNTEAYKKLLQAGRYIGRW